MSIISGAIRKKVAALLGAVCLLGAFAVPAEAGFSTSSTTGRIAVYTFNVHQGVDREEGWMEYINSQNVAIPDIVLVQDLENATHLSNMASTMATKIDGNDTFSSYAGTSNVPSGYRWGVIWRDQRFNFLAGRSFAVWGSDACGLGQGGANAAHVRLQDKLHTGSPIVSAVSFKSGTTDDSTCAWKNTKLVKTKFQETGWGGNMWIFGTDANAPDTNATGWTCFYRGTNADIGSTGCGGDPNAGFRDPLYFSCPSTCLKKTSPNGQSRIDFLFARRGDGTLPGVPSGNAWALPYGGSNGVYCEVQYSVCLDPWSDHRSVGAVLYY